MPIRVAADDTLTLWLNGERLIHEKEAPNRPRDHWLELRPGKNPGDRDGIVLARRLQDEAGVAGIAFHPRHASQRHKGKPDYSLAAELVVRGFLVRPGSEFGLDGWIRVTVGPPPLMERFVRELTSVREGVRR